MGYLNVYLIISIILIGFCYGQENAQTRIAPSLEECYRSPEVLIRDNRLPMTMNTLIDLIRKIEDTDGYVSDIRLLSASLLHRFRQDGIQREYGVEISDSVLPFSPSGYQYHKNRLLLTKLVPGNANNFPNDTLSVIERCSLHFMLSSSIETHVRGDESERCGQLSQYRLRGPRDLKRQLRNRRNINKNIDDGDVEILSFIELQKKQKRSGRMELVEGQNSKPIEDDTDIIEGRADDEGKTHINNFGVIVTNAGKEKSACPVENGVIRTNWGSVSAGAVIAGIAAGLQPQTVKTSNLLDQKKLAAVTGAQNIGVENIFAATLAGDLAELALLQGPLPNDLEIGASGVWNSTSIPKWYFLTRNKNLQMTDAEIRGGLDGLILATYIQEWRNQAPTLKLSQLLEMYYSINGVFSRTRRACKRNTLFTEVAPIAKLKEQTTAFSVILDKEMQLKVSIALEGIAKFSSRSADALSQYIPQLTDINCGISMTSLSSDDIVTKPATEIIIFVDSTWPLAQIQPIVAELLENLNVKKLGSSFTLLGANDANVLVNRTFSTSDMYQLWNFQNHSTVTPGLNLPNILRYLRTQSTALLDAERTSSSVGGRSFISLIITNTADVNEADKGYAIDQINEIREESPDLKIMFFAGGVPSRFAPFVVDEGKDIFQLNLLAGSTDSARTQVSPVIQRIEQVPRRVINNRCGSNWQDNERANSKMVSYVEPNSIAYYRTHPNYFFLKGDDRKIKIQGNGMGTISVCSSRTNSNPRMNSSNSDSDCRLINGDTFEMDLSNACEGKSHIRDCEPQYFSVEGIATEQLSLRCADADCPFQNSMSFSINTENLGCYSGVERILSTLSLILLAVLFVLIHV